MAESRWIIIHKDLLAHSSWCSVKVTNEVPAGKVAKHNGLPDEAEVGSAVLVVATTTSSNVELDEVLVVLCSSGHVVPIVSVNFQVFHHLSQLLKLKFQL